MSKYLITGRQDKQQSFIGEGALPLNGELSPSAIADSLIKQLNLN